MCNSYAKVYSGKQRSSWHGTSVQVAQPMPSLGLLKVRRMLARMEVGTTATSLSYQPSEGTSTVNNNESTFPTCRSLVQAPSDPQVSYHLMMTRKRAERESPLPSPSKLTRSPAPKVRRRMRTGTEQTQTCAGNHRQQSSTSLVEETPSVLRWRSSNFTLNNP